MHTKDVHFWLEGVNEMSTPNEKKEERKKNKITVPQTLNVNPKFEDPGVIIIVLKKVILFF